MYIVTIRNCPRVCLYYTISLQTVAVVVATLLLASGCGRSGAADPVEDEKQEGITPDVSKDAGLGSDMPDSATGGSYTQPPDMPGSTTSTPPSEWPTASVDAYVPDVPSVDAYIPDVLSVDASRYFDEAQNGDTLNGAPEVCEKNSDCATSNRCEIPVCTASKMCSYLPIEDGMPCYRAFGNQICLDGVCKTSSCGDGYLDTNSGEICDDGNSDRTDDCVNCREATCGDSFLHRDDEECEPALNDYCRDDCTLGSCGDGIVTSPAENCEPEIDGSSCNDVCRLSNTPQWDVEIGGDALNSNFGNITNPPWNLAMHLLLDSAGRPVVVSLDSYEDEDNLVKTVTVVTKFDRDGKRLWQWKSDQEDTSLIPSLGSNDPIHAVFSMSATIDKDDQTILSGMILAEELSQTTLPWLAKIDSDGQLLWSTTVDQDEHSFCGVAVDDQFNIMALMSSMENMFSTSSWPLINPSLELFSSDGTYRMDDSVAITGNFMYRTALSSGMVGDSSRFFLSGSRWNSSGEAAFMALLDSNGEMVWDSPIYYADETDDLGFLRALAASDGDIVVLGKTDSGFDAFPYNYWLERYGPDKSARYDERKEFRIYSDTTQQMPFFPPFMPYFQPMAVDGSNHVFFAYALLEQIPGGSSLIIDKYDLDGDPVWERPLVYDTGTDELHGPIEIAAGDQGLIYALEISVSASSTGFSTSSASLWLHAWPDPDHSE